MLHPPDEYKERDSTDAKIMTPQNWTLIYWLSSASWSDNIKTPPLQNLFIPDIVRVLLPVSYKQFLQPHLFPPFFIMSLNTILG